MQLAADASTVEQSASTDGASAECTIAKDLTSINCSLSDTKGDSHPVFLEWWLDSERHRFENNDGDGTTKGFSEESLNQDGTADTIKWKVCTDVQFRGDHCSQMTQTKATSYEVLCEGFNTNNPPSPSIPPDLQPKFRCYSTDPGGPIPNECEEALAEALIGVGVDGAETARKAAKTGEKIVLKKVPGIGWVWTGVGVVKAAAVDC